MKKGDLFKERIKHKTIKTNHSWKSLGKLTAGTGVFLLLMAAFLLPHLCLESVAQGMSVESADAGVSEIVHIPDENLREVVLEELEKEPGDDITAEDMEGITRLYAYNRGIVNLTGLEYADNLEELHLGKNEISDISLLSQLDNLNRLEIYENEISDISPLSELEDLQLLHLWNNEISDISPLSGLVNLQVLHLWGNQISDISPLSELENLWRLHLYNNEISDISPLSGLVNLRVLYLGSNEISDISPLSGLVNLWFLILQHNEISDISPLSGLVNLEVIYLRNNELTDLSPLSGLVNLRVLNFRYNEVSDLSPLSELLNMRRLDFRHNNVTDISPLSDLERLERVDIDHNKIRDISPLADHDYLEKLYIRHNHVNIASDGEQMEMIDYLITYGTDVFYRPQRRAIIDPSIVFFKLSEPEDVETTITWNEASVVEGVTGEGITEGDWRLEDNTLIIDSQFLEGFNEGEELTFYIEFDVGPDAVFEVNIIYETEFIIKRIYGQHRFETAEEISKEINRVAYNHEFDSVVLARGDEFPDALAGAPLAFARQCPLLLTRSHELPVETENEMERILSEGDTVYILGETAAVHREVEDRLEAMGYEVVRLGGISRFETAVEIANELAPESPDEVFLTTGLNFADAVSGSSPAARRGSPIILTRPGELPEVTESYLEENADAIDDIQVLGGEAAVEEEVFGDVDGFGDAHRIHGINRWETATEIAETFFTQPEIATMATGLEFPDALSGGVFAALNEAPVLLTAQDNLPDVLESYYRRQENLRKLYVFGGEVAIAESVLDEIRTLEW